MIRLCFISFYPKLVSSDWFIILTSVYQNIEPQQIFHSILSYSIDISLFVLKSIQKVPRGSYLYESLNSCMHLETYFFTFYKSNVPGFSPNFHFQKPVLKFAFNRNTNVNVFIMIIVHIAKQVKQNIRNCN